MTRGSIQEYTEAVKGRYLRASKKEKGRILDEFTQVTGYHRRQPEWYAAVDFAPEQVVSTRRGLLNRAMAEKALVLAFHFPFPGLGCVVTKGEGWLWHPSKTTG